MFWSWVTLILAGLAFIVNVQLAVRAYHRPGLFVVPWIIAYSSIAFLALFYTGAFAVLLFTDVDRATWSEVLTPSSAVSFLVVWIVPGILSYLQHRVFHRWADELGTS